MTLTSQELVYLAARTEAEQLFGVSDPFLGLSPEELRARIPDLQLSLCEKGLAAMDFGGGFSPLPETMELVADCAQCSRYLSADAVEGGRARQVFAYEKAGRLVLLEKRDGALALRRLGAEELRLFLEGLVRWVSDRHLLEDPRSVPFKTLSEAQRSEDPKACGSLLGCSEEMAGILRDGFSGRGNYYAFTLSDFMTRTVDSLIFLSAAGGALRMTTDVRDETASWTLWPSARDELLRALDELSGKLCAQEGGGGHADV